MNEGEQAPPDLPGVVAPAPLIFVPGLLVGLGLDYLWPVAWVPPALQYTGGIFLIVVSFIPVGWALLHFRRADSS